MSNFEKIIIPLISDKFTKNDFVKETGFIDSYTSDPDKPSGNNELFLVFDDTVRTKSSEELARRLEYSGLVIRRYIKYVNNKPYMIYSIMVNPTIKNMYNGIISLTSKQKVRILQFWELSEEVIDIICNSSILANSNHEMPLADYRRPFIDVNNKLQIKKGCLSIRLAPLYFLYNCGTYYRLAPFDNHLLKWIKRII